MVVCPTYCATDRFEEVTLDSLMMVHLQRIETFSRLTNVWHAYILVPVKLVLWTKSKKQSSGRAMEAYRTGRAVCLAVPAAVSASCQLIYLGSWYSAVDDTSVAVPADSSKTWQLICYVAVGTVTKQSRVRFPVRTEMLLFTEPTLPHVKWFPVVTFSRLKPPGREAQLASFYWWGLNKSNGTLFFIEGSCRGLFYDVRGE